ncbi:hypothetical protein DJ81_03115 [Halorubrum sp. Hd13]|nr:hypothetical protein DJ81_03115 [Halorubrum sp. Hd13]
MFQVLQLVVGSRLMRLRRHFVMSASIRHAGTKNLSHEPLRCSQQLTGRSSVAHLLHGAVRLVGELLSKRFLRLLIMLVWQAKPVFSTRMSATVRSTIRIKQRADCMDNSQ